MKVVILAGGLGTRLVEETDIKPKPMIEIGGQPIIWHIAKHYAHYGVKEFYLALGYRAMSSSVTSLITIHSVGSMTIDMIDGRCRRMTRTVKDGAYT
jgi:glucose-1-phosphate cytidylyltransferase